MVMTGRANRLALVDGSMPKVDPTYERNLRQANKFHRARQSDVDEVRGAEVSARAAYDLANPRAVQDAKAAEALAAKIADYRARGVTGFFLKAMENDLAELRERNTRPPQTVPTQWAMRKPFPADVDENEEVPGLVVTGTIKQVKQAVREAQKAALAAIAEQAQAPQMRIAEDIDEEQEETLAEIQRAVRRVAR